MDEHGTRWLLFSCFLLVANAAYARVQDYQIVRLLTYRTDCQLERLEPRKADNGTLRFFATCANVTFYPEGIEVTCADADDDRSCTVKTRPRSFDQLNLLAPRH